MDQTKDKKTTAEFEFKISNGILPQWSKEIFRDQLNDLKDGKYKIQIKTVSDRYTATRWKYLYDCVYRIALPKAKQYLRIQKGSEQLELKDVNDLHNCMLSFFNQVMIVDTSNNKISTSTESSTKLSDDLFWFPFVESICYYFASAPYHLEIPDNETWKEIRKNGGRSEWDKYVDFLHENNV